MSFAVFLWLLIWGGMFTGIYNILTPGFTRDAFSLFQGLRALLPVFAAYLSVLWVFGRRSRIPYHIAPLRFLFMYTLVGIVSSFFLSSQKLTAMYWVSVYIAPLFAVWIALDRPDGLDQVRKLLRVNYAVFFLITISFFPQSIGAGLAKISHNAFYALPFGLGEIRSNGVGRYALVVLIVAAVRFLLERRKRRYLWLAVLLPSLLLLVQTQSRTALLGLAVAGVLLVFLWGLDIRYGITAPAMAYLIWLSGIKWRYQGRMANLMLLTGREYTWQKGVAQIKQSPFLGWGFHADRILLNSEHMHNSYLHAMIHSGIIGAAFFLAALVSTWALILRSGLIRLSRSVQGPDRALIMESIMITGFLTARSFFESTAAFFGVDLLLLVPTMAFLYSWVHQRGRTEAPEAAASASGEPAPFDRTSRTARVQP